MTTTNETKQTGKGLLDDLFQLTGTVEMTVTSTKAAEKPKKKAAKESHVKKEVKKDAIPLVPVEIVTTENGVKKDIVNMETLDKLTVNILEQVDSISKSFCKIGFFLWKVKHDQLYKARGFAGVGEYAESILHFKKSSAYSYIKVCERFSVYDSHGYPTAELKEGFKQFNFTQLLEALPLPESQLKEISPEMSAQEIRKIKNKGTEKERKKLQEAEKRAAAEQRAAAIARPPETVFSGVLTIELFDKIIERLEGFVGRDIEIIAETD